MKMQSMSFSPWPPDLRKPTDSEINTYRYYKDNPEEAALEIARQQGHIPPDYYSYSCGCASPFHTFHPVPPNFCTPPFATLSACLNAKSFATLLLKDPTTNTIDTKLVFIEKIIQGTGDLDSFVQGKEVIVGPTLSIKPFAIFAGFVCAAVC